VGRGQKARPDPNIARAATNGNYVLGGSRFEAEIAAALKRRVARGKAGRPKIRAGERGQPRPASL